MGDQECLDAIIAGTISGAFEDDEVCELKRYAFYGCNLLTSVSLPNCKIVKGYSFQDCTSLASVSLPNCESVGELYEYGPFQGCTSLASVSLPKCTYIEDNAFQGCTSLASLTLESPTMVTLHSSRAGYQPQTFDGTPIASGNGTVYVPANLVATYQANSYWSRFNIAAIQV